MLSSLPLTRFSDPCGRRAVAAAAALAGAALLAFGWADDSLAQIGQSGSIADVFAGAEAKAKELTDTVVGFVRVIGVIVIIALGIWALVAGFNRGILVKLVAAVVGLLIVAYADQLVGWMVTGTALAGG